MTASDARDGGEPLDAILNENHPRKLAAAQWARDQLEDPDLVERDHSCTFWFDGWKKLAAEGTLGLLSSPAYGGGGTSLTDALLTFEGMGHGCRDDGLVFALTSQVLTMQLTLERFGTQEQCAEWLPRLHAGDAFGAFSMSEPETGSDAYALTATATPTDTGYILNGEKAWVTMAPIADVFIVFATTSPDLGRWGITAFLVPADTPGLTIGPNRPKMGLRTTPFANITFTECVLPASARIGADGAGASIFSAAMEAERGFLLIGGLGALERMLDDAVEYARHREQFGQPIGAFQGVSHAISEVKLAHESARLLLYKAAILHERGTASMMAAALAKLAASEAALRGGLTGVEVHGARGYVTEYGVERDLRNMAGGVIYGGANGIQKNIVARLLGLPT
ncbi:MAG: acyl-CoA dehydrogenase family protein [Acidimicrobiales bacterium]